MRRNLWIGSKATHCTDAEIVHVYCVMDGAAAASDWFDTRAEAANALATMSAIIRDEPVCVQDEYDRAAFAFAAAMSVLMVAIIIGTLLAVFGHAQ